MAFQKRPAPTRARFQHAEDDGPRPKRRRVGKAQPRLEVVGKGTVLTIATSWHGG